MLYLLIDMPGIVQKAVYKSHISVSVIFVDRRRVLFRRLFISHTSLSVLYLLIDMQGIVQKAVYKSHISVSVIFVDKHAGHCSEGCL